MVVVQLCLTLLWQKASWITNGSLKVMSSVQIYVQLAWLLLTFWNIYLRLANCWMSYFGASFFFLVSLYYLSIPRPQESLIDVEPISPYTVFIQTQSLVPPLPPFYTWTFVAPTNICKQTNFTIHTSDMLIQVAHLSHWKASNLSEKWHADAAFAAHTRRSRAASPRATHSSPPHVTATCHVCFNECLPFQ